MIGKVYYIDLAGYYNDWKGVLRSYYIAWASYYMDCTGVLRPYYMCITSIQLRNTSLGNSIITKPEGFRV